jgi:hypothetical protein
MDLVSELQGMEMRKRFQTVLMNTAVLLALAFFYLTGTQPLILLISGVLCLVVLNVVLEMSRSRR